MREIHRDFPFLQGEQPIIYLDNAATTQTPALVWQRMTEYDQRGRANVHRGIYRASRTCQAQLEEARQRLGAFLGGDHSSEFQVIYTGGATAALNAVAWGLSHQLQAGDEVLVSSLEHHANFVPWQKLCARQGATLRVVPLAHQGCGGGFDLSAFGAMLSPRTRVVAVTQMSNVTGELLPLPSIYQQAKGVGATVVVDGAQGIRQLNPSQVTPYCDAYCFSAHKLFGPMGVGVLYGRRDFLEQLEPLYYGGGMVDRVTPLATTYAPLPHRLEAGTLNGPGIVGLDAALSYLQGVGHQAIRVWEQQLMDQLVDGLLTIPHLHIVGDRDGQRSQYSHQYGEVVSFTVQGVDCFDLACYLDELGIAVRQGTHCAQITMGAYGVDAAVRISPAFYNTEDDILRCVEGVAQAVRFFRR